MAQTERNTVVEEVDLLVDEMVHTCFESTMEDTRFGSTTEAERKYVRLERNMEGWML